MQAMKSELRRPKGASGIAAPARKDISLQRKAATAFDPAYLPAHAPSARQAKLGVGAARQSCTACKTKRSKEMPGAAQPHIGESAGASSTPSVAQPMVRHAIAISVKGGAPPSHALSRCAGGLTMEESVEATVDAVKSGHKWRADPTALVGHYSQQTRLLPNHTEVTGPEGNTNSINFCEQVKELRALGGCDGHWYMLAAVVAHEAVHSAHFPASLAKAAPAIQAEFNALTVPHAEGKTSASALAELKALKNFADMEGKMLTLWRAESDTLLKPDHQGTTRSEEHCVVDPMADRICAHAKAQKWHSCRHCP
ncbi:MAG TPA: hypothetical protein VG889_11630 [Rhizomicrobium sp.]|nr:hypothetical protein [Rhizomicrobium sp.]